MNLKDMTIGIIGGGVVGSATARAYLEHVKEVRVWDIYPKRRAGCYSLKDALKSDLVFVCLPEAVVGEFFKEVNLTTLNGGVTNFVLRSTVPIGTTRRLAETYKLPNLVHSPEFLTARCSFVDAQMPSRNIVGLPKGREWFDHWHKLPYPEKNKGLGAHPIFDLHQQRFPSVVRMTMNSDESEAVKLYTNAFFAAKVSIWNEFRELSDKLGLDWDSVRNAILADGRIHPSHTQVPGPDGRYGFGGACLPKDLRTLINCYFELNIQPTMLLAADRRNDYDRNK